MRFISLRTTGPHVHCVFVARIAQNANVGATPLSRQQKMARKIHRRVHRERPTSFDASVADVKRARCVRRVEQIQRVPARVAPRAKRFLPQAVAEIPWGHNVILLKSWRTSASSLSSWVADSLSWGIARYTTQLVESLPAEFTGSLPGPKELEEQLRASEPQTC